MKSAKLLLTAILLLWVEITMAVIPQQINYQGHLARTDGTPLDTVVTMDFTLYDAASGGVTLWSETQPSCTVEAGLFQVLLGSVNAIPDAAFDGPDTWLGVTVGTDTEMSPRERIASVGYSYRVGTVDGASGGAIGGDVDIEGKVNMGPGNTNEGSYAFVSGRNNHARGDYSVVSGGGGASAVDSNSASGEASTISGGRRNTATNVYAAVSGGYGNEATGDVATVGGGMDNKASRSRATVSGGMDNEATGSFATVGGGRYNYARGDYSVVAGGGGPTLADSNSASGMYSAIGGGQRNVASSIYATAGGGHDNVAGYKATVSGGFHNIASSEGATVGGGGYNRARGTFSVIAGGGGQTALDSNSANGSYATVSGGWHNDASGNCSAVGGGLDNDVAATGYAGTIGGGQINDAGDDYATVGGGYDNDAIGYAATIGGGRYNRARGDNSVVAGGGGPDAADSNSASGYYSVIGGGRRNEASGFHATVPGGLDNTAQGSYSFAAGRRAKANLDGCFRWADSYDADFFRPDTANTFSVRATGGVFLFTNSSLTSGARLFAGSSTWNAVSDSTMKRRYGKVDTKEVLDKVATLPIERWSYKAQDESVHHIGPMAQDFWRLFHVGDDSLSISTIDPDGIALAAIQELEKRNQKLEDRIAELEKRIEGLAGQPHTGDMTSTR